MSRRRTKLYGSGPKISKCKDDHFLLCSDVDLLRDFQCWITVDLIVNNNHLLLEIIFPCEEWDMFSCILNN